MKLTELLERNRRWADDLSAKNPEFFKSLSRQQHSKDLWIGCSYSRVPANQITGMQPGEVFVHRNVANVVVHTDLNCLSSIQFAVDLLKVEHIIVCGHYGCSGVGASLAGLRIGLADNWLRHIGDVYEKHLALLNDVPEPVRHARLCELNVFEQVVNVCRTTVVQEAWNRGQALAVHGWIYGLDDGRLRDLGFGVTSTDELLAAYNEALELINKKR